MSAAWVAGSVRARALARRRLGAAAARRLAASHSLPAALEVLAATSYGHDVRRGQTLGEAEHAVASALLWDLRVLAGWVPQDGVHLLRTVAAWFEIANVDELLRASTGVAPGRMFRLGALATAWNRLRDTETLPGLRAALAASAWGDPGGDTARAVRLGMRARWAQRAGDLGGPARSWAAGAAALLVAGERFAAGREVTPAVLAATRGLIGSRAAGAATPADYAARLPERAAWVLAGADIPGGQWRAEAAWWAQVEGDGLRLLRTSGTRSATVLGAAAVLGADAWRTRAALEMAARGGVPMEAFDAVA